jgi:uncharacterized protein YgiM (DUF1202 family)
MNRPLSVLAVMILFLVSSTSIAVAGSRHYRHYDYGYRHYGHHPVPYRHYYPAPYRYRHHHDTWLPMLGVGLVTGAMVGAMAATPSPPRTVYYPAPAVTVYSSQVSTPPPLVEQPELVLRQVSITEKLVNVRSGPGLDTAVLDRAVAGQVVDVIGAAPEWLYIRTENGRYGWIMTRYTTEVASPLG